MRGILPERNREPLHYVGLDGPWGVTGMMRTARRGFTAEQAAAVADELGIDFDDVAFDATSFRKGMEEELEHGLRDPETNVTDDDPIISGKIAWAHLKALPDYYERLESMEREAEWMR